MLIPFGTDRPLHRPPLIAPLLIGINIAFFLAQTLLARSNPTGAAEILGPLAISGSGFRPWQLLSYAFLHADWAHVLGNMLVLWVFGPNVEDRLTRRGFLAFYLFGGAVAGGVHALFETNPAIGASGAVAAVTGAYMVLFPRTNVKCLVFLIIIGVYQIPAWFFIVFAIAKDIVFAGLGGGNVAYLAHLGGYGYGIAVSLALLSFRVLKREPYDLFTIGRQAYRRRQMREAAHSRDRRDSSTPLRRGAGAGEPPVDDGPVAKARAAIFALIADQNLPKAAEAYKRLVEEHAANPAACTLSRRPQLDIADHLFTASDFEPAAYTYQNFLQAYPRDTEAPRVRLILALINTRYLNDPVRARQLLANLTPTLADAEQRQLAETLLTELG